MQLPVNRSPAKNRKCSYQLTGHLQKIGDAVTSLNEAFTWFSTALVETLFQYLARVCIVTSCEALEYATHCTGVCGVHSRYTGILLQMKQPCNYDCVQSEIT
jgi:hypothetical protein